MDPELIGALGQTAGGAYVAKQLLGPTLEMLGYRTRDLTDAMITNVTKVIRSASEKADLTDDGSVPPRALARVWDEAVWADDDVVVEYLGGVLASARTPSARDDRGAVWARKVGNLSVYAVRLHYLLYEAARQSLIGRQIRLGQTEQRRKHAGVYVPSSQIYESLETAFGEKPEVLTVHAIRSLQEEDLLDESFLFARGSELKRGLKLVQEPPHGLAYWVTHRGMELFLVAHGISDQDPTVGFLDPSLQLDLGLPLAIPLGTPIADLRINDDESGGPS